MSDYSWVERIKVLDAVDTVPVDAVLRNEGWKLLHVGTGKSGQTTLTFGWPAHGREEDSEFGEPLEDPSRERIGDT